jgi:hydrogenase maturation protein HypF
MEGVETLAAFGRAVDSYQRMYRVEPAVVAVDAHPGYATGRWARRSGRPWRIVEVQHHHAHIASVMADNGLDGRDPVIGFAFDGSGYGTGDDGRPEIWGGEVLLADYGGFRRAAHLRPLPLPGGDGAVANPCRVAVAWLAALGLDAGAGSPAVAACDEVELGLMRRMGRTGTGTVPTTSVGRLFDVVSSLLGICHRAAYEAQAAVMLEAAAEEGRDGALDLRFGLDGGLIDPAPVLAALVEARACGVPVGDLARAFHRALADAVVAAASRLTAELGLLTVALSGGVWQNALLTTMTLEALGAAGLTAVTHRSVPSNDGGLALGQAVIAAHARS